MDLHQALDGLPFDINKYIHCLRAFFRIVVIDYWASRSHGVASLQRLSPTMLSYLDRNHATIVFENGLCECFRRRSAALAWVAYQLDRLPKGRFDLKKYMAEASMRQLKLLHLLVLCEDGMVRRSPLLSLLRK